jgi:hypothetical protein
MVSERRGRPAPVLGPRRRGEGLARDPRGAPGVVDGRPPAAGARAPSARVASEGDRAGAGDEDDARLTAESSAPGDFHVRFDEERCPRRELELDEEGDRALSLQFVRDAGETDRGGTRRLEVAAERRESFLARTGERFAHSFPADVVGIRGTAASARDHRAIESREHETSRAPASVDADHEIHALILAAREPPAQREIGKDFRPRLAGGGFPFRIRRVTRKKAGVALTNGGAAPKPSLEMAIVANPACAGVGIGSARELASLRDLGLQALAARSPSELCERTAGALALALPDRGVHVQIWSRAAPDGAWDASAGPEMSIRLVREPLLAPAGPLGEIVVDARDRGGRELDEHERAWIAAAAETIALAAARELEHAALQREHRELELALSRLAVEETALERLLHERKRRVRGLLGERTDAAYPSVS